MIPKSGNRFFRKSSCANKKLERDGDPNQPHPARSENRSFTSRLELRNRQLWRGSNINRRIGQLPAAAFASTFAQVSRKPTVRLKMSRPGLESGSRQK